MDDPPSQALSEFGVNFYVVLRDAAARWTAWENLGNIAKHDHAGLCVTPLHPAKYDATLPLGGVNSPVETCVTLNEDSVAYAGIGIGVRTLPPATDP